ncbi:hypothetical protein AL523_01820 [Enterococcus gallinarum]|nr:hypothetical protein AL523_01820 [Enterococcus gallinarum]
MVRKKNAIKKTLKASFAPIAIAVEQFREAAKQINTSFFLVISLYLRTFFELISIFTDVLSSLIFFLATNLVEILVRIIYILLLISFIWICYLLYVGLNQRERLTESAEIASLIVSVITVISITVAIYEFYEKKKEK